MSFADDWIRRARRRHRDREQLAAATTVRVLSVHPRHGKTMAAAALLTAGMLAIPGTLRRTW